MQKRNLIWLASSAVLFFACIGNVRAQVNIGSNTVPNSSAMLEVTGTTKGLLMPRIALTSTASASPLGAFTAGMVVYNTATAGTSPNNVVPGFYLNDGVRWLAIGNSLNQKSLTNSTTPAGIGIGEIAYNTNSGSGVAAGPVYWNGTSWVSIKNSADPGVSGTYYPGASYSYVGIDLRAVPTVTHNVAAATFTNNDAAQSGDANADMNVATVTTLFNSLSGGGTIEIKPLTTSFTSPNNYLDISLPSPAAYIGKTFFFYIKPDKTLTLNDGVFLRVGFTSNAAVGGTFIVTMGDDFTRILGTSFQAPNNAYYYNNSSGSVITNTFSMIVKVHALNSTTWIFDKRRPMMVAAN